MTLSELEWVGSSHSAETPAALIGVTWISLGGFKNRVSLTSFFLSAGKGLL